MTLRHFQIFLYVHDEGGMTAGQEAFFDRSWGRTLAVCPSHRRPC